MKYRWNEPLPKGTTAEELSLYDPRRPRSGSEIFAGLMMLLAIVLVVYRVYPGIFTLEGRSFRDVLLRMVFYIVVFSQLPLIAGAWVTHRVFKMDYREEVKGRLVFSRGRVDRNALLLVVAVLAICAYFELSR